MKSIRWKILTVLGVFAVFFAIGVYPILANRYHLPAPAWIKSKQLRLGLDLQGGVHLVLRVHTDEALRTSKFSIISVRARISAFAWSPSMTRIEYLLPERGAMRVPERLTMLTK